MKEWLTLDDAAKHLSIAFGEEVTRADVLRLAIDGRLTLSVDFVNHAQARKGKLVSVEQCTFSIFPSLSQRSDMSHLFREGLSYVELSNLDSATHEAVSRGDMIVIPAGIHYREREFLVLDKSVESISGVWDLPMLGGEAIDVEHRYQMETGGPSVTLHNLEGAFVERSDVVCQLQDDFDDNEYESGSKPSGERLEQKIRSERLSKEQADQLRARYKEMRRQLREKWKANPSSRYYPAAGLPEDAVYVVRTAALRAFEQSVLDASSPEVKLMGRREETTLLNIVGGLLGLLLGKSPAGKAHSVFKSQAAVIDALVANYPGKPGMSARNLEDKLAQARRSLDA